jgi:hypothetical protein
MKQNLKIILTLILLSLAAYEAYSETISISTYYPSPYGSYQNLTVTGKLGVGTTSPVAPLVVSNGGAQGLELNSVGASANAAYLQALNRSTNVYTPLAYIANSHDFYTPGVGYGTLYINNSGRVGIGTTNPTAKLHIKGTPFVDGIRFPDNTLQTTAAGKLTQNSCHWVDAGWMCAYGPSYATCPQGEYVAGIRTMGESVGGSCHMNQTGINCCKS